MALALPPELREPTCPICTGPVTPAQQVTGRAVTFHAIGEVAHSKCVAARMVRIEMAVEAALAEPFDLSATA